MKTVLRLYTIMKTVIRNNFKIITIVLTLLVLYNEILIYHIQEWPAMKCTNDTDCTKILLVADLQLLGERYDKRTLSFLFNWDCDRYLAKTFSIAMSYFTPDIVIFLGDVIDEGTIATDEEYQRYIKRLSMITATKYPCKYIWIPGDNDIGGEDEPIYEKRIELFKKTFKQSDYTSFDKIDIYHVNKLIESTPVLPKNHTVSHNRINILISHFPILINYIRYPVIQKFDPSIIFSGHKHESLYMTKNKYTSDYSKINMITPKDNKAVTLDLNNFVHEISVPTCSYRMGVEQIGYGAAIIDTHSKIMQYSVFWSPRRFPVLRSYLLAVLCLLLYLLCLLMYLIICRRVCFKFFQRYSKLPV